LESAVFFVIEARRASLEAFDDAHDSRILGTAAASAPGALRAALAWLRGDQGGAVASTAGAADKAGESSKLFDVRLHNDDVHTYDDVTSCLRRVGLAAEQAQRCTVEVDKQGESVLLRGVPAAAATDVLAELQQCGLVACALPTGADDEARCTEVLAWLERTAARGPMLRGAVAAALAAPLNAPAVATDPGDGTASPPERCNERRSVLEPRCAPRPWSVLRRWAPIVETSDHSGNRTVACLRAPPPASGDVPSTVAAGGSWRSSALLLLLLSDFFGPADLRSRCLGLWLKLIPDAYFSEFTNHPPITPPYLPRT